MALASIVEIDSVHWFGDSGEQPTVRNVVEHVHIAAVRFEVHPEPDHRRRDPAELPDDR